MSSSPPRWGMCTACPPVLRSDFLARHHARSLAAVFASKGSVVHRGNSAHIEETDVTAEVMVEPSVEDGDGFSPAQGNPARHSVGREFVSWPRSSAARARSCCSCVHPREVGMQASGEGPALPWARSVGEDTVVSWVVEGLVSKQPRLRQLPTAAAVVHDQLRRRCIAKSRPAHRAALPLRPLRPLRGWGIAGTARGSQSSRTQHEVREDGPTGRARGARTQSGEPGTDGTGDSRGPITRRSKWVGDEVCARLHLSPVATSLITAR